jgi:hypothetical protein
MRMLLRRDTIVVHTAWTTVSTGPVGGDHVEVPVAGTFNSFVDDQTLHNLHTPPGPSLAERTFFTMVTCTSSFTGHRPRRLLPVGQAGTHAVTRRQHLTT